MRKEKNVNYYRDLLHKDAITLLVISIIFTIINVIFTNSGVDEAVDIVLKSILFAIFSIIIICNKKETKKFIGSLTIIYSCLMILTSISDGSLFGIVYLFLGIFLIIHSILYLRKLKDYNVQNNYSENTVSNTKFKYISLIPLTLTILLYFLLYFIPLFTLFILSILIINVLGIILCIILHKKNIKSALVYIVLIISIIITFISGGIVIILFQYGIV